MCAQELRELNLSETPVSDEDLCALRALPRLRVLRLNRQPARHDVSNAGLAELAQLPRLACLELQGNCAVTARGGPCTETATGVSLAPASLSVQRAEVQLADHHSIELVWSGWLKGTVSLLLRAAAADQADRVGQARPEGLPQHTRSMRAWSPAGPLYSKLMTIPPVPISHHPSWLVVVIPC